ncbi:MAG: fatty acid--CoA ligase [Gammaproteobacteria bacterium]|nr:fatty acid--CoA ligase [Gammaproteobacteria bacterium]
MSGIPLQPAASAYSHPLLIKHLLHTPLINTPHQEIVYADLNRYDYNTLRRRIGQLASGLAGLGLKSGDTVAVMDWDSHRYLECFFTIPMIGAVLHTVNIRLSPEQILYTINHAEDDFILVHTDFLPILEQIKDRIARSAKFLLLSDQSDSPPDIGLDFAAEYEQLLSSSDEGYEFSDFDENTRATTFYSTGTTGNPKGVYYSHRQLVLHTLGAMSGMGTGGGHGRFHRDDVYMPITPMFHVHAWGIPYVATLMGVKQVYPGRYVPEKLLELIAREKVTFSHCVPTILHMLLSSPAIQGIDLSGWKVIIGGSAMPKALAKRATELGIDVMSGYGLSETCPVLTIAQLDASMLEQGMERQLELRCKAGRALPLVDLRLVDEDMNEVAHDGVTTGEVVVRSPWLTQAYLKDPQTSDALWRGGYLHTGDIGNIDDNGWLKVTDRIKDVIKTGGEWISSLMLEDIVSEHPAVNEVAAIGIPDDKWGERPLVLVVPKPASSDVTEDDLKDLIRQRAQAGAISPWAVPDRVILVDEIDKTSVGKIDKKKLRDKYS